MSKVRTEHVLERVLTPTAFQAKRFFERGIIRYRTLPVFVAEDDDTRWHEAGYALRWYKRMLKEYPDKFIGRRIVQDREKYVIYTGDGHWNPVDEIALVRCPRTTCTGNANPLAILIRFDSLFECGSFWLDQ